MNFIRLFQPSVQMFLIPTWWRIASKLQRMPRFQLIQALWTLSCFLGIGNVTAQNLIRNGTFSDNATSFAAFPGYVGGANAASIAEWRAPLSAKVGINGAAVGVGFFNNPFGPTNSGIFNGNYTYAFIQGDQSMHSGISQDITLTPNTTYQLSFDAAANAGRHPMFLAQVVDARQIYFTSGPVTANDSIFSHYNYTFTTPAIVSGTSSLQIINLSAYNTHLIDVANVFLGPGVYPENARILPMDRASPLTLKWLPTPNATSYDIYLGTNVSSVSSAMTTTSTIYRGSTNGVAFNVSALQPTTTYYWRVDTLKVGGISTKGIVYTFTTGSRTIDLMEDTWVATDGLNRTLPGIADCGMPRTNRLTGIMYFLLHNTLAQPSPFYGSPTEWNISQYLSQHPYSNPHNPWTSNPLMQTNQGTEYWWGEPELGYYSPLDPWVLRRQIALLSHANIDVIIFDTSNSVTYDAQLYAFCDMIEQMKSEGLPIPFKITFLTHTSSGLTSTYLYNTLYASQRYSDLWFYWDGKPLMLGNINGSGGNDIVPSSSVQSFFTWKTSWANVDIHALHNEWQEMDSVTPQNWGYGDRSDLPEELPVSCSGWANSNSGRSYSNHAQQDYDQYHMPLERTTGLGIFFKEQMNYGLKYDPQCLWFNQWNEWVATSIDSPTYCYTHLLGDCCPQGGFFFVDEYNEEYSRDIEPMNGGHTDSYYYQMVSQNRVRKGVRPVPAAGPMKTVSLAGDFSQWTDVEPSYYDAANDTIWRKFLAAVPSQMGFYTNSTGRNDFTLLKVARNNDTLFFLAECSTNITSYAGSNWMVLFIDADQNHSTGWEGYDFAVNLGGVGPSTTTLHRNVSTTNGWSWTAVRDDIAYRVLGNRLMLAIPRSSVALAADPLRFDFHWADNFQTNNILDFAVNGDSAPDRRFNYRFSTVTNSQIALLADDFENGQQSVWGDTWASNSLWSLTSLNTYSGNYSAVATYTKSGQSNLSAEISTEGYGSFHLNLHYKIHGVDSTEPVYISYLGTNGWVPIRQLSRDDYYPIDQAWGYEERQDVWLNFDDTRYNVGPDSRFFSTNFAFRIEAGALVTPSQKVFVDAVNLTAQTETRTAIAPEAWQSQDIGNAGNIGLASIDGGFFYVSGAGLDIFNKSDAFRILYQTRTGNGQFTARVSDLTGTDPWGKAGVMIRESLDPGSRNVLVAVTVGEGVAFQSRSVALGETTMGTLVRGFAAPSWIRLVRYGDSIIGYASTDGNTWSEVGATNIVGFNGTALWGLAVSSHSNTLTNMATFDNVVTTQNGPIIYVQPVSSFIEAGADASFSVSAFGEQPLYYQWNRNGIALTNGVGVSGVTNATLIVGKASPSDLGAYSVVISNAFASVVSAPALLSAPVLLPALQEPGFEVPNVHNGFKYSPSGAGWVFGSGAGISGNGSGFTTRNSNAPEGAQVAFLQGGGSISQTVNLPEGEYQVVFSAAQRAGFPQAGQSWDVSVDGLVVGSFAPPQSSIRYQEYRTRVFQLAAGIHTLAFVGTDIHGGDNTILIDNVRILGQQRFSVSTDGIPENGTFQLAVIGPPAVAYLLEVSTNLSANGKWIAVETNAFGVPPFIFRAGIDTNADQKYYRVVKMP